MIVAVVPIRKVGIFPVLENRQKKYQAADRHVVPHFDVVDANQQSCFARVEIASFFWHGWAVIPSVMRGATVRSSAEFDRELEWVDTLRLREL